MQAWLCEDPSGVDRLRWTEVPDPEPAPHEVRIRVHAASLNFPDLLIVQNKYQVKPPLPFVPGSEFSGTVDKIGAEVRHLQPGDRVAALGSSGGFGTLACADARRALPLPDGFPLDEAAAFAFTYGTSHHALMDRGALQPGETVLVLGAAGGVGTAAVQIAKAAGARVIAGASTDEKCAFCRSIGADESLNYSREDVREALRRLTDGKGPDVVYDAVGGDLAEPVFRSIAWRGRYLVVGFAQGGIPSLPFNLALLKGAAVIGVFWGSFTQREPQAFASSMAELLRWHGQGKVRPSIDSRLPLAELPQAYERMGSRQVRGKLLLIHG